MKTDQQIQTLWEKLYSYARRRGRGHHDAEDFVQSLFQKLFRRGVIERFLETADSGDHAEAMIFATAKRLLLDQERHNTAAKRGGKGLQHLELEEELCPADENRQPDRVLETKETLRAIDSMEARLQDEYHQAGKGRSFAILRDCLFSARSGIDSEAAATELGLNGGTLRAHIFRIRARFRQLVALELAA